MTFREFLLIASLAGIVHFTWSFFLCLRSPEVKADLERLRDQRRRRKAARRS